MVSLRKSQPSSVDLRYKWLTQLSSPSRSPLVSLIISCPMALHRRFALPLNRPLRSSPSTHLTSPPP
jgi:hypothetical protein